MMKEKRSAGATTATASKRKQSSWWETIKTIAGALAITMVVRIFFYEPFSIPSGSMLPTLWSGDFVFVSKTSYGYSNYSFPFSPKLIDGRLFGSEPQRGDVIVFRLPTNPKIDYIKRLIGLPGDRIQVKEGILYINGTAVPRRQIEDIDLPIDGVGLVTHHQYIETLPNGVEHRIAERSDHDILDNTREYVVPAGHYFFMGDNRDNSEDSRVQNAQGQGPVAFVPLQNLIGRADLIFFSFDDDVSWWEVWRWPFGIRYSRLMDIIT